mmetsp:Transcript_14300/g.39761  ORF Transcript_14300/g.39761 Transcript_14300/m.39761 type:complete len:452 (-) Transcript_14300:44-1399(-)
MEHTWQDDRKPRVDVRVLHLKKKRKSRTKRPQSSRTPVSVSKKLLHIFGRGLIFAVAGCVAFALSQQTALPNGVHRRGQVSSLESSVSVSSVTNHEVPEAIRGKKCAILLFGLPRAFRRLVLPSLKKHVIGTNKRYGCDWFVHWYTDSKEMPSRSGFGGGIDTFAMLTTALKHAILADNSKPEREPEMKFATDTNATFWEQHSSLMHRILTEKGKRAFRREHSVDPRLLYWPVKDNSYNAQTLANVVKSWHSIQRSFELALKGGKKYDRVAVLRSDVMYLTPIDIWARAPIMGSNHTSSQQGAISLQYDVNNQYTLVPGGFGMFPVNDRFVVGPAKSVQVWATKRFSLLKEHVHKTILEKDPGFGMHNERFLSHSIFPLISNLEYDMNLCLVRVRADSSVWVNDCGIVDQNVQMIEQGVLHSQCRRPLEPLDPKVHTRVVQLFCDIVEIET